MKRSRICGTVALVIIVGCREAAVAPPTPQVAAKPVVEAPKPVVDDYQKFKNVSRMAVEDIQSGATPREFAKTWELVSDEYQQLRMAGKAKPAADVYGYLDTLRVAFGLAWQTAVISEKPVDVAAFKDNITTVERLLDQLK